METRVLHAYVTNKPCSLQEESLQEIDPAVILAPGARRSTRGVKVDYTSAEALAKAGLKPEGANDDDSDDDVQMKDD